jgi:sugar phosphate isomerase/epimerase
VRTGFSCYKLDPYEVAARMGRAAGHLEVLLPAGGLAAAKRMRSELFDASGIAPILTVLVMPKGVVLDSEGHATRWRDGVAFIDAFGAKLLRVVGVMGGDDDKAFIKRAAAQIEGIMPDIEKRDITLAYENHGEKTSVVRRLLDAVDSPRLGVLLDPPNGYMSGEDPVGVLEALLPQAAYLHVKDVPLDERGRLTAVSCPVGEGSADWRSLAERLKAAGKDFLYVFELPACQGDVFEGYQRSLAAFERLFGE